MKQQEDFSVTADAAAMPVSDPSPAVSAVSAAAANAFTPGPWEVVDCPCGHRACNRKQFANVGVFHIGSGFDEADARLISTAPDLLEALKECALQIAQNHGRKLTVGEEAALDAARAAIAKATGSLS